MAASSRYESALERNLAELQKALLIRATLLGIEKHRYTTQVFIRVIRDALHNDHMSHAIKIFEQSSKAASFWYLYRTDPGPIDKYALQVGYDVGELQIVADKLKAIRNGSHFHIDKTGVLDPKLVWSGAALTGKELGAAIDFAWGALSAIQKAKGGEVPSLLDYTPDAALAAVKRVECGDP
ncbi:MAG: hypothetical protein LBV10_08130 [Stenotrophomonas sp.]|jgi:hypothetical protein|uniref:hypothetical protein n=1 Tax=Stenotrophomonas sp. TaxID=69392 RepID=UPI0028498FBC|nr:hypothetical protein [Stenotrophomonas sp.]MDR2959499.1 hypothetical protein [Stenotrophomonas sp.]